MEQQYNNASSQGAKQEVVPTASSPSASTRKSQKASAVALSLPVFA